MKTREQFLDQETGEYSYLPLFNVETGEYEGLPTRKFKVPSSCIKPSKKRRCCKPLKANPHELELITAAIFLLPTMILFHPSLSIVAFVVEIFLHIRSHKKNKKLKDKTVYFKSPLHSIVKEFCGRCKEESATAKMTRIQDIRNDRFKKCGLDYIRRVVT